MLALVIAVAVSAAGGCLAYLFKDTVLAAIFAKPDPAQQAINTQRKMDSDEVDRPQTDQAIKELDNDQA